MKGVEPDIILPDSYRYLDIGEREYDHSIPWSAIDALNHKKEGYTVVDVDHIRAQSDSRVASSELFQLVEENALRLKDQRDRTSYPLDIDRFRAERKERKEAAKKFDGLKEEIEDLEITNLEIDLKAIQADSTLMGRNEAMISALNKDIYLNEGLYILRDVIESAKVAKLGLKE